MRPVEVFLKMGGRMIKENDGEGEFKTYCKHFFKYHYVPPVKQ
jgi:hypothetical protein